MLDVLFVDVLNIYVYVSVFLYYVLYCFGIVFSCDLFIWIFIVICDIVGSLFVANNV